MEERLEAVYGTDEFQLLFGESCGINEVGDFKLLSIALLLGLWGGHSSLRVWGCKGGQVFAEEFASLIFQPGDREQYRRKYQE